jgi:hypothetical protein
VFNSAVATFQAPSDLCGWRGMQREYIRATDSWQRGLPCHDTAFLNREPDFPRLQGIDVVLVRSFFSFEFRGSMFPCVLVFWFKKVGEGPDEDTGMWVVELEHDGNGHPITTVIHLDCMIRACHLVLVYGQQPIPKVLPEVSLYRFRHFYVNKYVDHHAFKLAI